MTKNWVCHSWKNRSWIDCHKFGSPLKHMNARKDVFALTTKFCSHIIYIYLHYIKLLCIWSSTWGPLFDLLFKRKASKHSKSTWNLWIFYATYNVWRENTHKCLPPLLSKDMSWANVASYITLFWNTVLDDSWNMIYLYFYGWYQAHLHTYKPLQF